MGSRTAMAVFVGSGVLLCGVVWFVMKDQRDSRLRMKEGIKRDMERVEWRRRELAAQLQQPEPPR
ncbi:mitochondrial CIV assembly protein Pet117 [Andalucia godoyi]|uniref:Mitochondrial CIV assembly protein Pet117 n=1 Tax=Andalucia godoyi TaxID=505711 RepID=A0A8K0F4D1_ANDGO|nr:mitochondrial CIV assembly protein Pet117 [Andalucia godoyi]|eukprot:ANDGO_08793.mRNA.1 mitochondrial CIV assembly protein Pet117